MKVKKLFEIIVVNGILGGDERIGVISFFIY